jgi:acetylglutamate kinase
VNSTPTATPIAPTASTSQLPSSVSTPQGFTFAGISAGIKPQRKDLALVFSSAPCNAAGVFTVNKAKAAPVIDCVARLPASGMRAVVINSGNANALTGGAGLEDVGSVCAEVARGLLVSPSAVLSASTGIIGVKLPLQKIVDAVPQLVASLETEPDRAAEAIMTTDTRKKVACRVISIGGKTVTLTAIGKGSGMIAPQLATMIVVLATDCAISQQMLASALGSAGEMTFNRLTVDDDMSTNDAVFALANGLAGNASIDGAGPAFDQFSVALHEICEELAMAIAADGEGATKRITTVVKGAPSEEIAKDFARAICGSSLVKAAIFGADPNWGRILSTVGARAGSQGYDVSPYHALVSIQGITVYDGAPVEGDRSLLKGKMRLPEVDVVVDCRAGDASATAWGCDLSYDYVKINADYSSLIVSAPDGGVAKDDRLANYSPAFKVSLLVQALGYIDRFKGQKCVIKYGGAAMSTDALKSSFCEDVLLLRAVGLLPVVVHGGGPDISRALAQLGGKPEFIEGQRVTPAADLKVVEMVLTGSINTEIVTLLNRKGANAVGLSGKDGALLRAKKLVRTDGIDLGQVGELETVNAGLIDLMLEKGYTPVISPVGIGDDGESYNLNADVVASGIATAIKAPKLLYLSDVAGIMEGGELVSELTATSLQRKIDSGIVAGGMAIKARSILNALRSGVRNVHILDGRTPHTVIAELFTETGVGTVVHAD